MESFILETGIALKTKKQEKVLNTTEVNTSIKDNLSMAKEMEKGFSFMQMEASMKDSFSMDREMALENIMMQLTRAFMKDSGRKER